MGAVVPARVAAAHQAKVGFVYQGRGLERLPRWKSPEPSLRQRPQLGVQHSQEFIRGKMFLGGSVGEHSQQFTRHGCAHFAIKPTSETPLTV
jgi:hypothetical protein